MSKRRPSIAWRLAIGLAAFTGLLWIGAAAITIHVTQEELFDAYDESMRQSALRLLPLALHNMREPVAPSDSKDDDDHDEDEEYEDQRVVGLEADEELYSYAVRDPTGRVVLATADAPAIATLRAAPDGFSTIDDWRLFSLFDRRSGHSIVVAEHDDNRKEALHAGIMATVLPLAALIPLIVIGIWVALRLALSPLRSLSRDIARRGGRNLSPLPTENHPVELAPIAEAIDGLLDRLRDALDTERAFAASSAHELRTPIAGALAQAQRLAIELQDNPSAPRVGEIESALKHLSQLSEKLLQLSRLGAGFAQAEGQVDLAPILELIARDYESASQTRGRVHLDIAPGAAVSAPVNGDAFAIAITNLIENALHHGTSESPVELLAGPGAHIRVVNASTIVPPEVLDRLGEPFMRGATSAGGTGLGLTIARTIAEQTGGRLELMSPAAGRADGFEAVLSWA